MTNNAVNPFVYVCGNKKLQLVFKQVLYRLRGIHIDNKDINFSTIVDTKPTFLRSTTNALNLRASPRPSPVPSRPSVIAEVPGSRITPRTSTVQAQPLVKPVTPVSGKEARRAKRRCSKWKTPGKVQLSPKLDTRNSDLVLVGEESVVKEKRDDSVIVIVGNGLGDLVQKCEAMTEKSSDNSLDNIHEECEVIDASDEEIVVNDQEDILIQDEPENEVLVEDKLDEGIDDLVVNDNTLIENCNNRDENFRSDHENTNGILSNGSTDKIIENVVQGLREDKINGTILGEIF